MLEPMDRPKSALAPQRDLGRIALFVPRCNCKRKRKTYGNKGLRLSDCFQRHDDRKDFFFIKRQVQNIGSVGCLIYEKTKLFYESCFL